MLGQRGTIGLLFLSSLPSGIRGLRVRADAAFGYGPVLDMLEARAAQYAVAARMIPSRKEARRCMVARRKNRGD